MAEAESKAAGLISWLKVARQNSGADEWARFLAALPPESRALVERPPLPVTWLPAATTTAIIDKASEMLFGGDVDKQIEVARQQLRNDLSTIYRVFIKVASPKYVASRAAAIYGTYFRNNGTMRVIAETDNSVDIVVEGVRLPSPSQYANFRGSILGALELTRVKNPRVVIVSGGGATETSCLYRASWD
jgi:hypothetical protein